MTERETILAQFEGFDTWADVLAHVEEGKGLHYHAPLQHLPVPIMRATVRGNAVHVVPWDQSADPFMADAGHLSRFLRRKVIP